MLLFFLFDHYGHSQTFFYKYKCTLSGVPALSHSSINGNNSDSSLNDLRLLFPLRVNASYEILSDGKFMILQYRLDSSSMGNSGIKVNTSGDPEIIIDIKNKLIYYPTSKVVKRIKSYFLDSIVADSNECIGKTVLEKGPEYKVVFCKSIPVQIMLPVLFNDLKYGIQSINSPQTSIELSFYKKVKKDKRLLECSKYFKQNPILKEEEGFFDD